MDRRSNDRGRREPDDWRRIGFPSTFFFIFFYILIYFFFYLFFDYTTNGIEEATVEEIEEGEEADDEDEEDLSSLYKTFREIYVFLAHIYPKETGDLVMQGLQVLVWFLIEFINEKSNKKIKRKTSFSNVMYFYFDRILFFYIACFCTIW